MMRCWVAWWRLLAGFAFAPFIVPWSAFWIVRKTRVPYHKALVLAWAYWGIAMRIVVIGDLGGKRLVLDDDGHIVASK